MAKQKKRDLFNGVLMGPDSRRAYVGCIDDEAHPYWRPLQTIMRPQELEFIDNIADLRRVPSLFVAEHIYDQG